MLISLLRREGIALLGAIRFFTRIPVSNRVPHSAEGLNHSARYFPLVGVLVGAGSALVFGLAAMLWPVPVAVLLAMAASIYLTGAFHEDGLSDMADGIGGGWDKARILEIMKDSRVGSYGVVALVLALLGKFLLLSSLPQMVIPLALISGHALSRLCSTALLVGMDYVREDASSKSKPLATRLSPLGLAYAGLLVLPVGVLVPWPALLVGLLGAVLATLWLARLLQRWLGGYTGDCLGATQQVSELGFYLGLLAVLH